MDNTCRLPSALLPRRLAHVARVLRSDLLGWRLDDDLMMHFERSPERVRDLTTLIAEETECCPFLSFELRVPAEGDIAMRISGPPDARSLLQAFAAGPSLSSTTWTATASSGDKETSHGNDHERRHQ